MTVGTVTRKAEMEAENAKRDPLPSGIVVGVDGSRESIAAFNTAAAIARSRGCALDVVSVIPPFAAYHIDPGVEKVKEDVDDLRAKLRDSALADMMHAGDADAAWTHEVVMGRPARSLVDVALDRGAEMIVVGRRIHGVMDRITGGETTLQVMRLASVPVLAVPSDSDIVTNVVIATDFSPSSERAAKAALSLIGKSGTMHLVYVEPAVELLPAGFALVQPGHPRDVVTCFRRLVQTLQAPPNVLVETLVLNGKAVPAIIEFAERVGANLIAAGSHGHAPLERFLLGSVSTGLVRNSACPVLVTPAGE